MPKQTLTVDVPAGFRLVIAFEPEPPTPLTPQAPARPQPNTARVMVAPGSKFARAEIVADGEPVTVAGCVADVLRRLGSGENRLRLRPETIQKLRESLPWVAAMLHRDHDAKVISNQHVYRVNAPVADLIRVTTGAVDVQ